MVEGRENRPHMTRVSLPLISMCITCPRASSDAWRPCEWVMFPCLVLLALSISWKLMPFMESTHLPFGLLFYCCLLFFQRTCMPLPKFYLQLSDCLSKMMIVTNLLTKRESWTLSSVKCTHVHTQKCIQFQGAPCLLKNHHWVLQTCWWLYKINPGGKMVAYGKLEAQCLNMHGQGP